ncbi:MAG TPA: dienelactone hydrolase family protein [Candidatus Lustribacter sp.]|jgi:carboxymethylenebutenolidase|nr:dienelactone hydrolase family protein [Candidatus Lustribacter sp.]
MSVTETSHSLPRFDGGTFSLTEASPGKPGPGIVFVSSAYGVTGDLRATMRHYAAGGFVVAAPDMFSRTLAGPLGQSEEDRAAARGRLEGFDVAAGLADVRTVMDALRARPDCTGAVAVVGYCFGGEFAYLATLQLGAAAAVSFHGVGIGKHLDQAPNVHVPMSLHFGGDDRFVPNSEIDAIETAHRGQRAVEIYRYPGAKHGFMQSESVAYDEGVARLADERALAMLARLQ